MVWGLGFCGLGFGCVKSGRPCGWQTSHLLSRTPYTKGLGFKDPTWRGRGLTVDTKNPA